MQLKKLSQSEYTDVPTVRLADINNAIDESNVLFPKINALNEKKKRKNDLSNKITFWAILIFTLVLFINYDNKITIGTFAWPILISFFVSIMVSVENDSKISTKSDDEIRYQQLMSKISSFNNDIKVRRNEIARIEEEKNKERARIEEEKNKQEKSYWAKLSGHEFEKQITELYRLHGFDANTTPGSGDGGIDIYLKDVNGGRYVVQCKNHKNPVGPAAIRELYGAMKSENIGNGIFIASSGYTAGAIEFANDKIQLLTIDDIVLMQRNYTKDARVTESPQTTKRRPEESPSPYFYR